VKGVSKKLPFVWNDIIGNGQYPGMVVSFNEARNGTESRRHKTHPIPEYNNIILRFSDLFPTLIQLSGFTELINEKMVRSVGACSVEYCVLPGNKKLGYCSEKLKISHSWPCA
jgi:hypothetical protein